MYTVSWSAGDGTTVTCNTSGLSSGDWVDNGTTISFTINLESRHKDLKVNNTAFAGGDYSVTVNGANVNVEATASYDFGSCIVEGTMITMANGTQKAVEDLQIGDMLLVFNHYTGEYDVRALTINAHAQEDAKLYRILNVKFSNGAMWRIVGHHGIFDITLNEYVMLSLENIDEFVGHEFYYTDGTSGKAVVLTSYFVTEEIVRIYSPVSQEFANFFANGLLTAPPFPDSYTAGHMNYFDFDENMMYVNVQEDIEKYGLYTYEDFADYIPEDVFNTALPFKYFKISVEKGLITWDNIIQAINLLGT